MGFVVPRYGVLYLPGTTETFSVEKYKECLGRPCSSVNLYLCKTLDYEIANELVDDVVEEQLDLEEIRLTKTQNELLCTEPQLGKESHSTDLVGLSSIDDAILTPHALENLQNCDAFEMNTFQGEGSEGSTFVPESMANEVMEREVLLIHRCNVKADLLHYFEKGDILKKCVDVKMIDSRGVEEMGEAVGVVRYFSSVRICKLIMK
ncbi:uncharacterized protein LOC124454984 isoform X2 [Xenia sp. Carnegie-2017]|uniref:uncharacterized protein LOC124454984 isoform X2 n=1 Tax=Xenia sp. Carnegie-2017 TaxID=2897299 RepID=UPI001F03BCA9|nr:uncharacterized protein LOC124454984 isoform X2 [Xenia sp. Carnegie-2017]